MKLVQINTTCGSGSTGKICVSVSKVLNSRGIENYVIYSNGHSDYPGAIKCAERFPKLQALKSRLFCNYGFNSSASTRKIIAELDRIQPDIVHLHNLHGHNCNLEMLMNYFREKKIKLFWTFHDCWAFTGYCPYYDMVACSQWKEAGCKRCPQKKRYSWFFDRSEALFEKKKQLLTGLNLTIITPSQWLADQVKQSFLKDCPVKVINNGINLDIFQPKASNFREKYHISSDKTVLLGVAQWVARKGADVFIRLAQRLDSEKFQIVMVGTDEQVDKLLPENVISIHRTENQVQLAEIYSAADLLVNPTREENFPTVNLESLACGTPVLTFRTGGSPEMLDETCGMVVERNDEEALYQAILKIAEEKPFSTAACTLRAQQFSEKEKFIEYYKLYAQIDA